MVVAKAVVHCGSSSDIMKEDDTIMEIALFRGYFFILQYRMIASDDGDVASNQEVLMVKHINIIMLVRGDDVCGVGGRNI